MTKQHILVVEDDAALLEGLRDILELAGFQVSTASNGEEGLAMLDAAPPELIVSDIMMPKMDGYRFYEAVRARPEHVGVPFIFLTAKGEKSDIRRGKRLGVDEYLIKPFDEEDLLVAVRAKLDRRAQLEAARHRQFDELRRTILVTLNHEFRTPLTYITSYSDLLKEAGSDLSSADFKNMMHGIRTGSERLRRLVEDFILLVELQTGEAEHTYRRRVQRRADLPALLAETLAGFAAAAEARNVRLVADIAPALPPVAVDKDYFVNALSRLIDNGIKFTKREGGQVELAARAGKRCVVVDVKDEGLGIRAEARERLFDIFYQIDRAKMEQQGSGSGLAIARMITRLHGGTLTVDSELGVGSTFTLTLPVAAD